MYCRAIPYEGNEPYIFICYCHKDHGKVYPILEQMATDGCRLWYDDGNHAGDNWSENIELHQDRAAVTLAFVSENSRLSHNCLGEINYALEYDKKIVPVLLELMELPVGQRRLLGYLHYLKSVDFPSDRALLARLYETESIKACKGTGSQPLKQAYAAPKEEPAKAEDPVKKPAEKSQPDFLSGLVEVGPVKQEPRPELKSEARPEPKPEPRPDPAPVSPRKEYPEEPTVFTPPQPEPEEEPTIYTKPVRPLPDDDDDPTVRAPKFSEALLVQPSCGRVYRFSSPMVTLGRKTAQIVIQGNDSISKKHATILQKDGVCYLSDENSANGTYLGGEQLEPKKQMRLENPAVFQLNDETLVLFSGGLARTIADAGILEFLLNEKQTSLRMIGKEDAFVPLNRNSKWADGTLGDPHIHRMKHARLIRREDGICLLDESPEGGNGTFLNGKRMRKGDMTRLGSGDSIGLGQETRLKFYSVTI